MKQFETLMVFPKEKLIWERFGENSADVKIACKISSMQAQLSCTPDKDI